MRFSSQGFALNPALRSQAPLRAGARRAIGILVLSCVLVSRAFAWGPAAHEYLGREGAQSSGMDARAALAVASGSLLADLDHTLEGAGVVGDSVAFARAVAECGSASELSNRFAAGWLAHSLGQDPGQGEIASRDAKMCADMVLVRTQGFPAGAALLDVERIRAAAAKLGMTPPSAKDLTKAAEKLVLLTLVETAALDMLPLELDEARALMPPELKLFERRMEGSLRATAEVLAGAAPAAEGHPHARGGDVIGLPPAAVIGVSFRTREVAPGLVLTTARLAHPLLFRTAIRVVVGKLGKRLFPAVAGQWDAGSRVKAVTERLRKHLEDSSASVEALFR